MLLLLLVVVIVVKCVLLDFFKLQMLLPGFCPYVHDANAVVVEAVVDVD